MWSRFCAQICVNDLAMYYCVKLKGLPFVSDNVLDEACDCLKATYINCHSSLKGTRINDVPNFRVYTGTPHN